MKPKPNKEKTLRTPDFKCKGRSGQSGSVKEPMLPWCEPTVLRRPLGEPHAGKPDSARLFEGKAGMNTTTLTMIQAEKIKAGLIWASQSIELVSGLEGGRRQGAEQVVRLLVAMIGNEANLARRSSSDPRWLAAQKSIDMALVMIDSGVCHDAPWHLTRALTHITQICKEAMQASDEKK